MKNNTTDEIVITALLKRFTDHRFPRAIEIQKRVFGGDKLTESDILFLENVINDEKYILRYYDKYPEYQDIVTKGIQLYTNITQKALENEENKH